MNNVVDFPDRDDDIGDLPPHQQEFDHLIERYASGIEPLENWMEDDLRQLVAAVQAELESRHAHDLDIPESYDDN